MLSNYTCLLLSFPVVYLFSPFLYSSITSYINIKPAPAGMMVAMPKQKLVKYVILIFPNLPKQLTWVNLSYCHYYTDMQALETNILHAASETKHTVDF